MEKNGRTRLLDSGLELLGRVGFRGWSMRAVEDEAGMPHGTARHHFENQRGLVLAMVGHLLDSDLPRAGETVQAQIERWLGADIARTRARYELMVAAFHDPELASVLVAGRGRLVRVLIADGVPASRAAQLGAAIDGLIMDAVLRGSSGSQVELADVLDRLR